MALAGTTRFRPSQPQFSMTTEGGETNERRQRTKGA